MPTKERIQKVKKVLSLRQPDLRVVLEEVTNTHNASAVVRTCDAAGVLYVDIIYSQPIPFPINEAISTRAEKWLHFQTYKSPKECFDELKRRGFKIAATSLSDDSIPYTDIDYSQPIAIVFGNESEGISDEAKTMADYLIKIPLNGMVQSLNLSVSVGIILYEALNQRKKNNYNLSHKLSPEEFKNFMNRWL